MCSHVLAGLGLSRSLAGRSLVDLSRSPATPAPPVHKPLNINCLQQNAKKLVSIKDGEEVVAQRFTNDNIDDYLSQYYGFYRVLNYIPELYQGETE